MAPGPRWPRDLVRGLVATTAAQTAITLAVFSLPVLTPVAARDLGAEPHMIGLQIAVVYLNAAAASACSAGLLRRLGPARCTQLALALAAAGSVLPALLGLPGAVAGAALLGLGYGLTNPAASQVLDHLAPLGRRNLVFSIKQTGVPLGGALAGLCLPSLAASAGWRAALFAVAAGLLLGALALGGFRRSWDAGRDPAAPWRSGAGLGLGVLRTDAGLASLAVTGAAFSAMQLALGAFTVAMLVEEFGWTPVAAGSAAAFVQVSGAVARLGWAALADRLRAGFAVLAAIGVSTALSASLLPLTLGAPGAAVLTLLCVLGSCAAGWNGVALAEAARLAPPGRAGAAVGAVLAVTFAGVVAGPTIFTLIVAGLHGYAAAFAALAVAPLGGAAIAWHARRRELRAAKS